MLLDSDVAQLYGYETKRINETANRNKKRFPKNFRFQLTKEETDNFSSSIERSTSQIVTLLEGELLTGYLKSQMVTSSSADMRSHFATASKRNERYRPYVYTEQGIAMLSGLLKSDIAVQVSINIMEAFVEMRKLLYVNKTVFDNICGINARLIEHDQKLLKQSEQINELFGMLDSPETNQQWIFFQGQFYDAFKLVIDLVNQAEKSIVIIDNYLDDSILRILTKKQDGVTATLITNNPRSLSQIHLEKFSKQYGAISVVASKIFHDRFVILDDKEVYAFGASLKDLGNKCFAVSKNEDAVRFVSYVNKIINQRPLQEF